VRFPSRPGVSRGACTKPGEPWTGSFRVQESSGSAQCAVLKVNAGVGKLLSTIKAHLVSPARNREWTAQVAMPAAKDPLEDGLYSKFHNLLPWQFALHSRALSCMRTLGLWVKGNSPAVEKVLRNYRFTYCWAQSPWQPCFDHAAPSEWSIRQIPLRRPCRRRLQVQRTCCSGVSAKTAPGLAVIAQSTPYIAHV
jgi:hypothetical protein